MDRDEGVGGRVTENVLRSRVGHTACRYPGSEVRVNPVREKTPPTVRVRLYAFDDERVGVCAGTVDPDPVTAEAVDFHVPHDKAIAAQAGAYARSRAGANKADVLDNATRAAL